MTLLVEESGSSSPFLSVFSEVLVWGRKARAGGVGMAWLNGVLEIAGGTAVLHCDEHFGICM